MSLLLDGLSLGWQTELLFARFDGEVRDVDDHLCVRTPAHPTYWWGNFLLFPAPPREGDLARWNTSFDDEIERFQPESRHRAFGVEAGPRFALPPDFEAAGFMLDATTVLTLSPRQLRAPARALPAQARLRVLDLACDAAAVVDLHWADAARYEAVDDRDFAQRQMARYAAMQAAGWGAWFGLEMSTDGPPVLAASCGLFHDPARADGLGRFQHVFTHPAWRRRGLCSALVHAASRHGFERMGLHTLTLLADPHDVAIDLYESLGYRRGATSWQIERPPLGCRSEGTRAGWLGGTGEEMDR